MHFFAYGEREGICGAFLTWFHSSIRSALIVLYCFGCHGHFFEVIAPFLSYAAAPQPFPSWIRLPFTADARSISIRHGVFCFRPSRQRQAVPIWVTLGSRCRVNGATSDWPRAARVLLRFCEQDRCNHISVWSLASDRCVLFYPKGSRESLPPSPSLRPSPCVPWGRRDGEGGRDGPLLSSPI